MKLSREEKQALVDSVKFWYHTIDLGDGVVTPGWPVIRELNRLTLDFLPASFAGRSVLDVGCWDGLFSFAAEQRDAASVLAVDNLGGGDGFAQADLPDFKGQGFEPFLAVKKALGSHVEYRPFDVYELSPEDPGAVDYTFFFGVLYHLWHPMLALLHLRRVTRKALFIETHVNQSIDPSEPLIRFYPGDEKYEATTWVGPNLLGLHAMLRSAGFAEVRLYSFRDIPERALGVAFPDSAPDDLVLPELDGRYVLFDPEAPGQSPLEAAREASERARDLTGQLRRVLDSRSWRLTAPLRAVGALLRGTGSRRV
jgi:tRNA (mo5U34)-methyltransferase